MSKVKFVTPYAYDYKKQKYSRNSGKSVTEPNKALSIPEIVQRYRTGRPVAEHKAEYSDEFVPDVKNMDFVDQQEFVNMHEQKRKELDAEIKAAKESKRSAQDQPPKPASAASGPRSDKNDSEEEES